MEVFDIAVSYMKLWHLLLDKKLKKADLERKAGISHYITKKMTRDESVPVEVLGRICNALECKVEDIVEFIPEVDGEQL